MHNQLTLRKTNRNNSTITVPGYLLTGNHMPDRLSFGAKTVECNVLINTDSQEEITVSEDIWNALSIPYVSNVHLFQDGDRLHIGPLVGIFTAGFTDVSLRPIGERTRFFAKLLSVHEDIGCFYFVFGAHHIDWEEGTVNGFFYENDGWEQIKVPLPDVIYDRLPNRRTEQLNVLQEVKAKLQQDYLIPWFNPGFFDKWEMHELLKDDDTVRQFLPETYLHPSIEDIERMLETHRHVYFKPAKGSLGLGIQQIIKLKDEEGYYCRFHNGEENRLRRFNKLETLIQQQFTHDRLKQILVQQGIHLIRWQKRAVDFRIHSNKNQLGQWTVSALAAKTAGSGSVTTHIRYGGNVKTIEEVLGIGPKKRKIEAMLKEAALSVSKAIDEKVDGHIGEFGFDLGVDHDDNIWLFEANAKPGRSIFSHPQLQHYDKLSRTLPLTYAIHLAHQSIMKPAALFV